MTSKNLTLYKQGRTLYAQVPEAVQRLIDEYLDAYYMRWRAMVKRWNPLENVFTAIRRPTSFEVDPNVDTQLKQMHKKFTRKITARYGTGYYTFEEFQEELLFASIMMADYEKVLPLSGRIDKRYMYLRLKD